MHIIEKAKSWSKDLWLQSMSRLIIKPIPFGLSESSEFNTLALVCSISVRVEGSNMIFPFKSSFFFLSSFTYMCEVQFLPDKVSRILKKCLKTWPKVVILKQTSSAYQFKPQYQHRYYLILSPYLSNRYWLISFTAKAIFPCGTWSLC